MFWQFQEQKTFQWNSLHQMKLIKTKIDHFLWRKSVPTETVKPRVILLILIKVKITKNEGK